MSERLGNRRIAPDRESVRDAITVLDRGPMLLGTLATNADAPDWLGVLFDKLMLWRQRYRERRQLASLSDHTLKDIGLSRADIEVEIAKRFWRL